MSMDSKIDVRIDSRLRNKLVRRAKRDDISTGELIRRLIQMGIDIEEYPEDVRVKASGIPASVVK